MLGSCRGMRIKTSASPSPDVESSEARDVAVSNVVFDVYLMSAA